MSNVHCFYVLNDHVVYTIQHFWIFIQIQIITIFFCVTVRIIGILFIVLYDFFYYIFFYRDTMQLFIFLYKLFLLFNRLI
ncbi:pD79L [African swine fever virus]|uniref:PD79L n=1 Tax=African swine fever virus TaxID=10497 RepID=A0A8A1V736_ASF|nr:pD79L [African swine fever virus]